MTPDDIIDAFSSRTFPSEAIAACRADKETSSQILLNLLEDFLNGTFDDDSDRSKRAVDAIFLVVHLLAEFREKRAFPLLMRLLAKDSDEVRTVLGDTITDTLPDIIISMFDGNIDSIHQLITNNLANEYARSSTLEALACLTVEGVISGDSTQQFLKACFDKFQVEKLNFVWVGWVESIAILGLESFVPLVEQAFREGAISPMIINFSDFQNDLRDTLDRQTEFPRTCLQRGPFENVDELSSWAGYNPERKSTPSSIPVDLDNEAAGNPRPQQSKIEQHRNPHRNVGRNDPCPCGSGKKFKKCCLQ